MGSIADNLFLAFVIGTIGFGLNHSSRLSAVENNASKIELLVREKDEIKLMLREISVDLKHIKRRMHERKID